jgi:hypothetical protein
MYKNIKENESLDFLNPILADLAVGDTKHDFGYSEIKLTPIQSNYNSGLPTPYQSVNDEEVCLASVIEKYTKPADKNTFINNTQEPYVPMKNANPQFQPNLHNEHTMETINHYSYSVSYSDVKPDKNIVTAQEFYDQLNITDTDIAIVIDAVSI